MLNLLCLKNSRSCRFLHLGTLTLTNKCDQVKFVGFFFLFFNGYPVYYVDGSYPTSPESTFPWKQFPCLCNGLISDHWFSRVMLKTKIFSLYKDDLK